MSRVIVVVAVLVSMCCTYSYAADSCVPSPPTSTGAATVQVTKVGTSVNQYRISLTFAEGGPITAADQVALQRLAKGGEVTVNGQSAVISFGANRTAAQFAAKGLRWAGFGVEGLATLGLGFVFGIAMDYADATSPNDMSCNARRMIYSPPWPLATPHPEHPKGKCVPKSTYRLRGVAALDNGGDDDCPDEVTCDDGTSAPDGDKSKCPDKTKEHECKDGTVVTDGDCTGHGGRGDRDEGDDAGGYPSGGAEAPCHWVYLGDVACTIFGTSQDCADEVLVCPGGGGGEHRHVPYVF